MTLLLAINYKYCSWILKEIGSYTKDRHMEFIIKTIEYVIIIGKCYIFFMRNIVSGFPLSVNELREKEPGRNYIHFMAWSQKSTSFSFLKQI